MAVSVSTEPAAYAEAARVVIVALVTVGWVTVDSNTVNTWASAVGFVLSLVLTYVVRSRVSPVAPPAARPSAVN
jgi:O-antigen/teichoic acid export membrane protein